MTVTNPESRNPQRSGSPDDASRQDPTGQENRAGDGGAAPEPDDRLQRALAEVDQMKDAWLRARADTENVRRQAQADVAKANKYAIEKFAGDLLAVKDALEQTLATDAAVSPEALKSGAELTLKALNAAFVRAQIAEIDPAGQKFDPHQHHAMQMVEAEVPPNTVVTVYQKGYRINDRVLRPALVTVASLPGATGSDSPPGG